MAKYSESQINNIYLRCNAVPMSQLLDLCLDPESGITVKGLRAVNYNKIDILEQQYKIKAEDIIWAKSQNSLEAITSFIKRIEEGEFTTEHLNEAKNIRNRFVKAVEDEDWSKVKESNDLQQLEEFINKCNDSIYSDTHLKEAISLAETAEWDLVNSGTDIPAIKAFIKKCEVGYYSSEQSAKRKDAAKQKIEQIESSAVLTEWNQTKSKVAASTDVSEKTNTVNAFIQPYANSDSDTARQYVDEAGNLLKQILDWEEARRDWIDAKNRDEILMYVDFMEKHPYSEYREEAEQRVKDLKGDLLSDMKRSPFSYSREQMYMYISNNILSRNELVDESGVLSFNGYRHILEYPKLQDEQHILPMSSLENPVSETGNTDIIFFGIPGSGKTCVLSSLLSQTGELGFSYDPKGSGGGGNYAMDLRNYARNSMLPPATASNYVQVIDASINDEEGNSQKIAFIEMSGEKTAIFAGMSNAAQIEDLGPGAAGILSNDNEKVIFFVVDPVNEKPQRIGAEDNTLFVLQSDVLACVSSLLSKDAKLMKKVRAIHVILTKSDTLGDYVDERIIKDTLDSQGYKAVFEDIKSICEKYDINKQTSYQVGLYPFSVGKFMPGDVYTFDPSSARKILTIIQRNLPKVRKKGFFDVISNYFNS